MLLPFCTNIDVYRLALHGTSVGTLRVAREGRYGAYARLLYRNLRTFVIYAYAASRAHRDTAHLKRDGLDNLSAISLFGVVNRTHATDNGNSVGALLRGPPPVPLDAVSAFRLN